jgi:hypothetical protein
MSFDEECIESAKKAARTIKEDDIVILCVSKEWKQWACQLIHDGSLWFYYSSEQGLVSLYI